MTQFEYAKSRRVSRACVAAVVIVVLALMTGDRPAGQIATLPNAVNFDGTNDYITFGAATGATGLNATNLTIELWFNWTGGGVATGTGGGGLAAAIPLVTKGGAQAEMPANVNMNYFLGISGGKLAADFENNAGGGNHPVTGNATITTGVWHHAAVTYDGSTWRLYLDGALDQTLALAGAPIPEFTSIQHSAVGTSLTSGGAAAGFFSDTIDEVRIWNVARSLAQINANRYLEVTSETGLIGRWGFNEGSGAAAFNSAAGRTATGRLTNGPTRVIGGLPADPNPPTAPSAPQNTSANFGNGLVTIAWPENPEFDLAGYNIYRDGSGAPLNVSPLTSPIFTDTVANGTSHTYTVRAIDTSSNLSASSTAVVATPNVLAGAGMQFNGSDQYVTFGEAAGLSGLGAQRFTLEAWFKRTGAGVGTGTGTGGFNDATTGLAIPLITKGRAQGDNSNVDMNYFLGINDTTGVLVVDFEDMNGAPTPGVNHPASGVTPIPIRTTTWHHAAATYDGTAWRIYLDGALESTTPIVGDTTPRFDSIQHAAIGSALQSGAAPAAGFFHGILDEVRIWDHARSTAQIQASMHQEIATAPGLIGRWALNEASGTTIVSTARNINGTKSVSPPTWTAGYPYPVYAATPAAPQGLTAQPGNARVQLNWTANSEADLAGYNVYRSTTSPVSIAGTPVNGSTLVTSDSYLDLGVTNGTTYFYVVTAVDAFGNVSGPSNEATATPLASLNQTPIVTAGPDRRISLSGFAALSGAASDDGPFSVLWTKSSGPGTVTFANTASASTTATFTHAGLYVLRLTADDGAKSAFDEMTVSVGAELVGAGDIAPDCVTTPTINMSAPQATAALLDNLPGTVFTLGDNSYQDGTTAQFANCYDPHWGRHKARTRPVTGNHDYYTANATPYYNYFNGLNNQTGPAGDRSLGYYSYNLGNWHVVVLNSECPTNPATPPPLWWLTNGCAVGSAQEQWLRADLAASPTNNIIAMWHRPLYSSSSPATTHAYLQPLWQALYDYGVDVWLGGHWHNYERMAPINASGQLDPDFGIRSFVIGTGGIPVGTAYPNPHPASAVQNNQTHGVMKFTLHDDSYDWQFIPATGLGEPAFTDSGTGLVHGPRNQPPVVNAGADQTVASGAASLNGSVTDDGSVTATWSQLSGPGPAVATFGNASSPTTSVGFPVAGVYELQLTANDGLFVRSDTVIITVTSASGNLPPVVIAGLDQSTTLPGPVTLSALIADDGLPGPDVTTTWSNLSPATGTVTFAEPTAAATTATFSALGTYTLRMTANDGELSGFDDLIVTVNPVEPSNAIDFHGTNGYVTFGEAPGLGLSTFTLEAWFRRDGAGVGAGTGSGGFNDAATGLAIPLVTKGRAQSDGSNVDMNYFLGINDTFGVLVADFEDINGTPLGGNHPVSGVTTIPISPTTWHHAAATYDGTTWRLYLDGVLEKEQLVGVLPRSDSIQHAAIGSALQSDPDPADTNPAPPAGFFDGVIDEVRIWNRALSLGEIQGNINQQITSAPDLVARWGLNEASGTTVNDSTPNPVNGTITGTGWTRTTGAPFNLVVNRAPNQPVLVSPANGATGQSTSPTLTVNVSDPDVTPVDVTFYGRSTVATPSPDFTIVALPDTQHYVDNPANAPTFTAQTTWIVNSRSALNTVFVSHLGDIVEHIDAQEVEWQNADASMDVLDNAVPKVPYGIAPGNHDMNSAGMASFYNQYFGLPRMQGNPWYGGYLGQNLFGFTDPVNRQNYNNFSLFTAGGMDFVLIQLEYDMPGYAVAWANRVLAAYPNRRAIIATHLFLNTSASRPSTVLNRTVDGTSAAAVWTNLIVNNCNVFLVLNGHYPGEANRTDLNSCGQPVHQLLSDYQSRTNGGDGWLRYMTFKPSENKIYVYTYSPTLAGGAGQFETDANSQFVVDYNMQGVPFTAIATNNNVTSSTNTSTAWPGRAANTTYEWYASVSDGVQTSNGPIWSFTTAAPANNPPTATNLSAAETYTEDTALNLINIVVSDTDSPSVTATLTLSTPAAGSLNTASSGGVTSTYNTASGVWTASGAIANVNTLLANLTFTPVGNFSSGFTIATSVSDGVAPPITGSKTMTGTAVNDAPTATNLSAAETYTEEVALNLINIVVTDVDSPNVTATLTLSTAAAGSLNTATAGTVTSTYNSGAGVWAASGALADVNALLAGLTFTPASNFAATFTIGTSVSDGVAPAITGSKSMTGTGVNDPPSATNLSAAETYTEDTALNLIDIVVTDDSPNVTATLTLSTAAAGSLNTATSGAVTSSYNAGSGMWTASGAIANVNTLLANLTFTPVGNFSSGFTIATSVSDGVAPPITGSKTMTGTAVNDAPTATNLSAAETYTEDTALNLINIVVSDADSPNVTATLTLSNVAAGSLTTGTSGTVTSTYAAGSGIWSASGAVADVNRLLDGLTFTPALNFNSSVTIATSVSDGVAAAVTGSKTMTGTAVNDAPTATNLSASETYTEDTALNLTDIVVTDEDGANVTATLTLSNIAAGSLNAGTSGTVTSTYATGTGIWNASGALANVNTLLAGLTFTPALNFNSSFTIATSVSDGVAAAVTGSKTMTGTAVNDVPTATNLSTAETYTENVALNMTDIVVTADSANVTATLTLSNVAAGSLNTGTSGTVTSTYAAGTGVWSASGALANVNTLLVGLTFTPALNFNNSFTIATNVSDGVAPPLTGSKTMTGTAVNDAPTATNLSAAETYTEDTALNLINIVVSDADSPNVTATLTLSNVAAGSLTTGTSGTVTSTYAAGSGIWSASGAVADVNTLLDGLTFTPALNFNSSVTIATSVSDGVAAAVTGSKTMTGTAVNDVPTATNLSTAETYTENVALNLTDIVVTDGDSPNVTATLTLSNPAAGSLNTGTAGPVTSTFTAGVWTASGALANVNTLLTGLTFTPASNFTASFTFATSVSDGVAPAVTGSKTMTGTAVNDAPTATNLSAAETYTEDTALNLINTVVTDGDSPNVTATLTLSNVAAGSLNTGTSGTVTSTYAAGTGVWSASGAVADVNMLLVGLTFTPALNFNTSFTIATSVSDGVAAAVTGSKTMTGTAVNDAPTATNLSAAESYTEDTALNLTDIVVSDVDSASVTATLTLSTATAGSLNTATAGTVTSTYNAGAGVWSASGALANVNTLLAGLIFTPSANFANTFTITTSVSDGVAPATIGSKTITGTAVNDPPTISDISNQNTTPGTLVSSVFTIGDLETAASLQLTGTSNNQTLVPDGSISFTASGTSRTVMVTPAPGQTGTATVTVTVSDGALSTFDTFVLNVAAAGVGPTVQLLSPNGGERLFTGSPFMIQWSATAGAAALGAFSLQYSTNGTSFVAVPGCTNLGGAMRQCTWATPVVTTQGRLRVIATDTASQSSTDDSDAMFSVVTGSPSVSVTGPSGGSTLVMGSVRAVTWTHNVGTLAFPAVFTIELSRNSTTGPWEVIASNVPQATATTGRFDWTVVGPTSSRVRFRVRPTNFAIQGTSNSNLTIANPVLALLTPVRSTTLRIGRRASFVWWTNLGNSETVKIEISRDAGATWELVAATVPAGSILSAYSWTVTGPATTEMRARVTWNRNPSVSTASSANNRITP